MLKKTKYRLRRFRHQNLAHHPSLFHTLDIALESVKLMAVAFVFVIIFNAI